MWILVKCGHLPEILARLPELPPHFALALLLFERESLRRELAERLGIPGLPAFYATLSKPRWSAADLAFTVRFGMENPGFQQLLSQSLSHYEYHLYNNYRPAPNWFFQDYRWFVRARGRRWTLTRPRHPRS